MNDIADILIQALATGGGVLDYGVRNVLDFGGDSGYANIPFAPAFQPNLSI